MKMYLAALAFAVVVPSIAHAQTAPASAADKDCCEKMKAKEKKCCCDDMKKKGDVEPKMDGMKHDKM